MHLVVLVVVVVVVFSPPKIASKVIELRTQALSGLPILAGNYLRYVSRAFQQPVGHMPHDATTPKTRRANAPTMTVFAERYISAGRQGKADCSSSRDQLGK